jgi:hypothetical protein
MRYLSCSPRLRVSASTIPLATSTASRSTRKASIPTTQLL